MRFKLEEGQQVVCHGDLDVYPPRGTYQLVVRQVEPQGVGALQLAFKQLAQRLEAEGLFDPARKRKLPAFPRRVGFVTSPTGAAIHDFLQVAARRFHGVQILVIPVRVQGEGSAQEIARGIALANRIQPPLDVLVVGRGGGSLEDLWSFNEEVGRPGDSRLAGARRFRRRSRDRRHACRPRRRCPRPHALAKQPSG